MKRVTALICSALMLFSLTACGGDNGDNTSANGETSKPEYSFYEECSDLPSFDSVVNLDYSSKSTMATGDDVGRVTYKYFATDEAEADKLIADYISGIENYDITTRGNAETEISIIKNDTIIATISNSNTEICLVIIPERNRVSSKIEKISIGDVITSDEYELTLKNVEFTYELLPKNTSVVYTSYPAESGKVYIHIEADVKNTMQRDIRINELFTAKATYDGSYNYTGFTIVNDGDNSFDWVGSYVAATPLETCTAHALIECPAEVDTSGNPVTVYLMIGKTTYEYTIR